MGGYSPLYIKGYETGLVQERENFMLPNDAFPVLENAYVWRERIKRKQGCETLGRLRRVFLNTAFGVSGASPWTFIIYAQLTVPIIPEANAEIEPGSVIITIQAGPDIVFTDQGDGTLTSPTLGNSGTINYITGSVTLTHTAGAGVATIISFNYFPTLPVMGLRTRELNAINNEMTIAFDTVYAYDFTAGWREFIPGTTWTGTNSNFFWTTNYWVDGPLTNRKIFWATNFSGQLGDPIRYTNGLAWADFAPPINAAGDILAQCLAMVPFRGRLVAFNTIEGVNLATGVNFFQRIRWAAIGTPFYALSTVVNGGINPNAWRDDIRGQGGFLDIPTSENIVSVGFVRDNLVIYCERSTWQLRYTGRSIAPFQIEKVNSELGAESTFSAVQFDTSLVGIGDKGVVECDSFKSQRIDVKIPDLVFQFNNNAEGPTRVHGIRDFVRRLAFWTYPFLPDAEANTTFPNRRLTYNYENDSWGIFTDSFTTFGTFQNTSGRTWNNSHISWASANFPWVNRPSLQPNVIAGNQEGYTVYVDSQVTNDPTLSIKGITSNNVDPTVIESPDHNLEDGMVIKIVNIAGTGYSTLNDHVFAIAVGNNAGANPTTMFRLYKFSTATQDFTDPQTDPSQTYIGGGEVIIRDNFSIVSKKFNFLEEGQNIQIGYIDLLMDTTQEGAISLNMFMNYSDDDPINRLPENIVPATLQPDEFFNITVPTTQPAGLTSSKIMQRVFCPARATYLTLQWTLSPAQMNGPEQESDVQIDNQVIWMRKAGYLLNQGI